MLQVIFSVTLTLKTSQLKLLSQFLFQNVGNNNIKIFEISGVKTRWYIDQRKSSGVKNKMVDFKKTIIFCDIIVPSLLCNPSCCHCRCRLGNYVEKQTNMRSYCIEKSNFDYIKHEMKENLKKVMNENEESLTVDHIFFLGEYQSQDQSKANKRCYSC